jgi:hypothetical protein
MAHHYQDGKAIYFHPNYNFSRQGNNEKSFPVVSLCSISDAEQKKHRLLIAAGQRGEARTNALRINA